MNNMREHITYSGLVTRYGDMMAYGLLVTFERLAQIKADIVEFDEETRLQAALAVLDRPIGTVR